MDKLAYLIAAYTESLSADYYDIKIVSETGKHKYPGQKRKYDRRALFRSLGFLIKMNNQGYHIYARPIGYEYILIDDITKDKLCKLMSLKPSIVMETSPENYQAFLHLKDIPKCRNEAFHICRELCAIFDADDGSAEPDHVGRLPGFLNIKQKHFISFGFNPEVILRFANECYTNFTPSANGTKGPVQSKRYTRSRGGVDRSKEDFAIACDKFRKGYTSNEVYQIIAQREKGRNRPDYVQRTVKNAYKEVFGNNSYI